MSYNHHLGSLSWDPSSVDADHPVALANQENRGYQVAIGDLGEIGLGSQFTGNQAACYLGTKDHPHLARCNPRFVFDNLDLDRLITATINREWLRDEHEPRRGILLMGPTGAGKTTYLRERLARQGIPAVEITWRPDMDAVDAIYTRELVGGDIFFTPAAIQLAAKGGYPVIINEIDMARPGQLVALNEIIDTGKIVIPETGETIEARRGFMVFATCNSSFTEDRTGAYAGARSQNVSVLNRFFKFQFGYPNEEQETDFIMSHFPQIPADMAKKYAWFVTMVRAASNPLSSGLRFTTLGIRRVGLEFSRRNLLDWLNLAETFAYLENRQVNVPKYALGPVFTAGLPDDERATVEHLLDIAFDIVVEHVEAA